MQNWQNYRQFMPDGMVAFFVGRYFWKMPADVQMPVGPTIIHPLPISPKAKIIQAARRSRI
jgi:hypothetical protein